MLRDKHLTIDVDKPSTQIVHIKQHDHGFPLIVNILDEGRPVDLTGYDVLLIVESTQIVQSEPIAVDNVNGIVTYNITSNMTSRASTYARKVTYTPIEIALYKQGVKISSFLNYFFIEESLTDKLDTAIEAQDNFSIVEKILKASEGLEDIKTVNEVLNTVQTDIDSVNNKLDTMNTTVNSIDTTLTTANTNINTLLGKVQGIDTILGDILGGE